MFLRIRKNLFQSIKVNIWCHSRLLFDFQSAQTLYRNIPPSLLSNDSVVNILHLGSYVKLCGVGHFRFLINKEKNFEKRIGWSSGLITSSITCTLSFCDGFVCYGLWYLTPFSSIFQLYHGENCPEKTCCKSLTNFIT